MGSLAAHFRLAASAQNVADFPTQGIHLVRIPDSDKTLCGLEAKCISLAHVERKQDVKCSNCRHAAGLLVPVGPPKCC